MCYDILNLGWRVGNKQIVQKYTRIIVKYHNLYIRHNIQTQKHVRVINKFRSSRSLVFLKIHVHKIFANVTGKHLCWSYTHISSFRKYTFQCQGPLNFADVSIFFTKNQHFLAKIVPLFLRPELDPRPKLTPANSGIPRWLHFYHTSQVDSCEHNLCPVIRKSWF